MKKEEFFFMELFYPATFILVGIILSAFTKKLNFERFSDILSIVAIYYFIVNSLVLIKYNKKE